MARRRHEEAPVAGVAFPLADGTRSTSATGRAVLAAAARPLGADLAAAIESEPDWRRGYLRHVRALVVAEVAAGADATAVADAGLAAVHGRFEFVRDGTALPLLHAVGSAVPERRLETVQVKGDGDRAELAVPYRGRLLRGDDLRREVDGWVRRGTVEPSFAAAVDRVVAAPDWLDLSDTTVVVLGAGAEMGPLGPLSRWGASVAVVDLPQPALWERVLATIRAGSGRAAVPVRRPVPDGAGDRGIAAAAGADLCTELPEVATWLLELDGPLILGNYVYAPGADNMRVAVAADALTAHLLARRGDVGLAGLLTPTDVYAVPEAVVDEASTRFARAGGLAATARRLTGGRAFAPNYGDPVAAPDGKRHGIADGLIAQQGPNYALAKRLQQWRLRTARDGGTLVSANVAPATSTRSVTRNRVLAAAYRGAARFEVEVLEPATSNTLMAALLVHDLRHPRTAGNPATELGQPGELFAEAAAHGGLWRQPYAPRSVLPLAAVLGLASGRGRTRAETT